MRDDLVTIIDDYLEAPAVEGATIRQEAEMLLNRALARMKDPSPEMIEEAAKAIARIPNSERYSEHVARAAWAAALRAV